MKPFEGQSIYGVWLQAAEHLISIKQDSDYNLILEAHAPFGFSDADRSVRKLVDTFLTQHGKQPLDTVADTIFPLGLYNRFGRDGIFEKYPNNVYPLTLKKSGNDWGRYAYRLVRVQTGDRSKEVLIDHETGKPVNPLEKVIAKLSNYEHDHKKAAYEIGVIDPVQDIPIYRPSHDRCRTMSGPCLSHLSFKVTNEKTLSLTAFYRSHYYVERALGNLIGLSWLLYFVSSESGIPAGSLTCISSMAQLENGKWGKENLRKLIKDCRSVWDASSEEEDVSWERTSLTAESDQ